MSTSMEINLLLGEKLKEIRLEKKMTREALSEKLDVSSRFLASVESGQVGISLATLKKICLEFGASADVLLGVTAFDENEKIYEDIFNRIKQLDKIYLENLLEIIVSFSNATKKEPKK